MPKWYIKELSKLTDIPVQTLHHYDRIGLLKPSLRLPNGYRVYSEKNLLKLQQIISLKFFGFELSQIAQLLLSNENMMDKLTTQSQLLEKKAAAMLEASKTLKIIINGCAQDSIISWENTIEIIDVYRRAKQLEKAWIGNVLNDEELKEYARFEQDLKSRFTENEIAQLEQERKDIIVRVNDNLDKDPSSDMGLLIAKRGMDWSNHFWGKYAALRTTIWAKGYKTEHINHIGSSDLETKENVVWFDKAVESYYFKRLLDLFAQISKESEENIIKSFKDILTEMYGDSMFLKNEFINLIMHGEPFDQTTKIWLKKHQHENWSIL